MQETESIDEYILQHIDPESDYLKSLYRDTHVKLLRPRMASGHLQGRMLKMFVEMIQPRQILEIGTYSGYTPPFFAGGGGVPVPATPPFVWRKVCRKVDCCIRLRSMMNKRTLPVHGWRNHRLPIKFVFI